MGSEIWAKCAECQTELQPTDKECPKCSSARKSYERTALAKVGIVASSGMKQKRKGFKRPIREMLSNRWKASGDSKLTRGVREDRNIDREKDIYDQTVRNAETGEIMHEEHGPLSQHNKKAKQKSKQVQHNPKS